MSRFHRAALVALLLLATGASPPARLASLDTQRGVPTFVWGLPGHVPRVGDATPEQAARGVLAQLAPLYRLTDASLRTVYLHRIHDTGRGGILVSFRQRVNGLDVLHQELAFLLTRDLRLVAAGGNLREDAVSQPHRFRLSHAGALAYALGVVDGHRVSPASLREKVRDGDGYHHFESFSADPHERASARVRAVLYPLAERLVPAYFVESFHGADASTSARAHASIVGAEDGAILSRRSLVQRDSFAYRVWASPEAAGVPLDGPQADHTPHPTGLPDDREPPFIPSRLVVQEGFNASRDPWLLPDATESLGNNVEAYADLFSPDGFSSGDVHAHVTGERTFDHVYDTQLGPRTGSHQTEAAVTQLFYTTNWLHDYFHDSGFNEAAGNAQRTNFGRGGMEGDPLLAEAQDHLGRDNANILVPGDGLSPRMQVFIWQGEETHFLDAAGQRYRTGRAYFGPQRFLVTAPLQLAGDGCRSFPGTPLDGSIAVLRRGGCALALKTQNAELAGARGVVIINDVPGAPPPVMANGSPAIQVTIPALSVTHDDGSSLEQALQQGAMTATLHREVIDRDGALDNTIVAHEWGHYLHRRLSSCDSVQCDAMSEGWGDFVALHMMVRDGDALEGSYAVGGYAAVALGDSAYYGIRRVPYSVDRRINALSFRHIAHGEPLPTGHPMASREPNNAEVHNAGEVFATLLFEGYIALLQETRGPTRRYDFRTAKRRMADYVVSGMLLAPADATYTEQLMAVLAAAAAHDGADHALLAAAFARRGAGPCALSPPRYSTDLTGVVEDFSGGCEGAPVADAGLDQQVTAGATVRLDASSSRDPDGDALSFHWRQVSGPAVDLVDMAGATTLFTAPIVTGDTMLSFRVLVSDGVLTASDTIQVLVHGGTGAPADAGDASRPDGGAELPDADGGFDGLQPVDTQDTGGCHCQTDPGASGSGFFLLAAFLCLCWAKAERGF